MHVWPGVAAIGVRLRMDEIGRVYGTANCGAACWAVFWRAVDIRALAGATLHEGDTAETLAGRENVYCLCVQSADSGVAGLIRAALDASAEFARVAASPAFAEGEALSDEPLREAGEVSASGRIMGQRVQLATGAGEGADARAGTSSADCSSNGLVEGGTAASAGDGVRPTKEALFTGQGCGVALLVSVAYVLWGLMIVHLPFSALSCLRLDGNERVNHITTTLASMWFSGLIAGQVGYGLWRSNRRQAILRGFLTWGLVGAAAGAIVGSLESIPDPAAGVPHIRAANVGCSIARLAAVAMGISVLFTSRDRRLILKSLMVPMAATLTLAYAIFTFIPFDSAFLTTPTLDAVFQGHAGKAAGIALSVALVVVIARVVKRKRRGA